MFEATEVVNKRKNLKLNGGHRARGGQTLPPNMYMDLSASVRSTASNFNEKATEKSVKQEWQESPDDPNAGIELMECSTTSSRMDTITDETLEDFDDKESVKDKSCWGRFKRLYHFAMETMEYKDPLTFGWRIRFRRIFLTLGTLAFTFQTIQTAVTTQNYSSKEEIQDILDYLGKCE